MNVMQLSNMLSKTQVKARMATHKFLTHHCDISLFSRYCTSSQTNSVDDKCKAKAKFLSQRCRLQSSLFSFQEASPCRVENESIACELWDDHSSVSHGTTVRIMFGEYISPGIMCSIENEGDSSRHLRLSVKNCTVDFESLIFFQNFKFFIDKLRNHSCEFIACIAI